MQSRKRRIGLFGALALAAVAVALAVTASLLGGSAAANAAGLANNARAESSNGVYYVQDPAHRLRVYTSDYKVAEDWAFCINNGRSYPGFFPPGDPENPDEDKPYIDGKYYYVGNEDKNFQDMLSTFLASRSLNNDQTTKAVRELLYVFHEDPEGWREKNLALFPKTDRGDLLWYWQIQQAIWHFSDNATMPNLLPREYVDRIERIARGTEKSLIPDTKKLEMRSYDAAGGWWRFGKQNVVSARVTENVEHYVRVIKLDGEKYGTMSDEQLIPVIEQNDQGLKGAKFGMYFEEGLIEFIDNSKPEKPLIPVQWETGSYARLFQFWEGDHAFRIAEEEAPKGYAFADPVNYTFDSRGNVKLVGDTDNVNERLITKDKINWQNYKYDKEFKEIPADVIVVFNYKSENTHPVKIEKTGSVMQDGKFSMQAIEGAKFKLQNTSSPDAAPIEWTSEAYLPKLLDLKPGFYELTEISAPEGYEKGIGMVTFRVESTGVITLNNGDADGAVTVSGNKLSVKNDSVRGVKTFATWKNEKAKRLFYDGQEYTNAPEELTVTDRIEYRGFEPGWYYAFATFVKNNGGEPVYSDGYVEFLVEDGKPDGVANVELNVKKSAIDVNAQTSFTVIEKIYKKDQVKEDEHQVPVRPEASVPTYAEHNDLESFDQTVMIDVTKPQGEVAFNKYDMKGAILDGAVLSVEINRDGQWVGLHEWTTAAQEDTVRLQLPAGSFRLVEKAAPAGYAVPANNLVFEFTVDDNGVNIPKGDNWTVSKENTLTKVSVKNSPMNLKGELKTTVKANKVESSAQAAAKASLNEQGKVSVSDTIKYSGLVPEQEYKVTAQLYEVANGKTVGAPKAEVIELLKTAKAGADGFASGSWEVNLGDVTGLQVGKSYVVYETAESLANLIVPEAGGKPNARHKVTHHEANDISQTFVVTVSSKKVTISKVDLGGTEIAGAKIQIKQGDQTVDTWTSVKDQNREVNLAPGTYTFHEESAPSGYKVVSDFQFTVADDGSVALVGAQTSGDVTVKGDIITVLDRTHPGTDVDDPTSPNLATTVEAGGVSAKADAPARVSAAQVAPGIVVVDKVAYRNLVGGKTYEVTGNLYEVVDGKVADDAKPLATKTVRKDAEASGSGTWEIEFDKVTGLKPGSSYVVFEEATSVDKLVDVDGDKVADKPQTATHKDPKDPSQTVVVETVTSKTVTVSKVDFGGAEIAGATIEVKQGDKTLDTWTSVKDKSHEVDLAPGTYTFHEVSAPSGYKVVSDFQFTIGGDGSVTLEGAQTSGDVSIKGDVITVLDRTHPGSETDDPTSPHLATTVEAGGVAAQADAPVKVSALQAMPGVKVVDKVAYKNLVGGKTYAVTGRLFEVAGGALVDASKPIVSKTVDLEADASGTGTWEIDFGPITGLKPGSSYVVFEKAVSLEMLVDGDDDKIADKPQTATHEDPTDPSQTVTVATPDESAPSLATTVKAGGSTASAQAPASVSAKEAADGVVVVDTVAYENLAPGKMYSLKGTLVEVKAGQVVDTLVEMTVLRKASDSGKGTWTLDFGTVEKLEPGKTYVVFEEAVSVESLVDENGDGSFDKPQVATHNNPTDTAQTVTVGPDPNTPGGEEPFVPGGGDKPSLKTTVTVGSATSSDAASAQIPVNAASAGVSVVDTVQYSNLHGGKAYKVTARLMRISNGALFEDSVLETTVTKVADNSGSGTWTIDLGETTSLHEGDSYVVFEYAESLEKLVDGNGDGVADAPQKVKHDNPNDQAQTFMVTPPDPNTPGGGDPFEPGGNDTPSLKTTASANGAAASAGSPVVVDAGNVGTGVAVTDTIAYSNLFGGKAYTVTATLKRVVNNQPVEDVATVTVQKVAVASGSGTWNIDLGTVALKPASTYVVYEKAVSVENLVDVTGDKQPDQPQSASHEDPKDKAQAVTVTDPKNPGGEDPFVPGGGDTPSLKTTVKAGSTTATPEAAAKLEASEVSQGVSVVDTIAYTNLYGGKDYEVTARLMPVKDGVVTGDPLVTVTVRRTADISGSGSWTVPLGTVEGLKKDTSYVVFEKAVSLENVVDKDGDGVPEELQTGSHEDPRDNAQTVTVLPDPKVPDEPSDPKPGDPEDPGNPDPKVPQDPKNPNPSDPSDPPTPGDEGPKKYVTVMPSTGDTAFGILAALAAMATAAGGVLALKRRIG